MILVIDPDLISNLPPTNQRGKGPPPLTSTLKLDAIPKGSGFLDPDALNKEITRLDTQNYARAHADWLARGFGPLDTARTLAINQALSPARGEGDPWLENQIAQTGLRGINLGNTETEQSRNLGQPIAAREDRNRDYFSKLLQANPERQFGLTSTDVANIGATNAKIARIDNSARIQSQQNANIAAAAQSAQNTGAIASGISGAITALTKNPYTSQYLNPYGYSNSYGNPGGGYYNGQFEPFGGNYTVPSDVAGGGTVNVSGGAVPISGSQTGGGGW